MKDLGSFTGKTYSTDDGDNQSYACCEEGDIRKLIQTDGKRDGDERGDRAWNNRGMTYTRTGGAQKNHLSP